MVTAGTILPPCFYYHIYAIQFSICNLLDINSQCVFLDLLFCVGPTVSSSLTCLSQDLSQKSQLLSSVDPAVNCKIASLAKGFSQTVM